MTPLFRDANAWSAIADAYDAKTRHLLAPFTEEAARWAGLGPEDAVLDVASGPGTTALRVAPRVRSVDAIDFAPAMVERLRENARDLPQITARVGDGQDLPYEDGRFDVAFSMFGLMFFADPMAGLRELHRVLKPGGRALLGTFGPPQASPYMRPLVSALTKAVPPPPGAPAGEPLPLGSADALAAGLTRAGFVEVEARVHAPEVEVTTVAEYWGDVRQNLSVSHLRRVSGERWPALEAAILGHLQASLRPGERRAMPAILGRGVKR